jgi:hypothetical protein
MTTLTPVDGAEPRYDDDGNEIMDIVTCGTCGRSWNDAAVSSWTPAPSGRCPFEYEHEDDEEETETSIDAQLRARQRGINHLSCTLEAWDEMDDAEKREAIEMALDRLERPW